MCERAHNQATWSVQDCATLLHHPARPTSPERVVGTSHHALCYAVTQREAHKRCRRDGGCRGVRYVGRCEAVTAQSAQHSSSAFQNMPGVQPRS